MIFVTTGTQLPFDRLLKAVDALAARFPADEFIVQVKKENYTVTSTNISVVEFIAPSEFDSYVQKASLIISHAGIGTMVAAAEAGKPLILFPRVASLKEHRNDHQLATCNMLRDSLALNIANTSDELFILMEHYKKNELRPMQVISQYASPQLVQSIRNFILIPNDERQTTQSPVQLNPSAIVETKT